MPEIPAEAVQAAAEALRTKQWGSRSTSAHGAHRFHGYCEVCQRNVEAIAEVAVEAAAPFMAGAGSPATCPSVAPESTESAQTPSAAPVYRPGVEKPAETLSALRDTLARVRSHCQQVANGQPWEDYEIGRHDHARHVLDLLDGAGAVPGEHTAPATTEETNPHG